MIRYKLSYLTSLLFLLVFSILFFSIDFFMPHLREWKSGKMLLQSKVYLDESIEQGSGLLEDGVRKAKFAFLLDPESEETLDTIWQQWQDQHPDESLPIIWNPQKSLAR